MTLHAQGRHRAPSSHRLPALPSFGTLLTATCRGGAVAAAGVGLVATMAVAPSAGTASAPARGTATTTTAAPAPTQISTELVAARTAVPGSAAFATRSMNVAKTLRGIRYRYGGTTPRGFDCSGFTGYVVKRASGITLPRTSRAQRAATRKISKAAARPGDLVFFHSSSGRVYHVALYAGNGYIWDSPKPGKAVSKRKIWRATITYGRVR